MQAAASTPASRRSMLHALQNHSEAVVATFRSCCAASSTQRRGSSVCATTQASAGGRFTCTTPACVSTACRRRRAPPPALALLRRHGVPCALPTAPASAFLHPLSAAVEWRMGGLQAAQRAPLTMLPVHLLACAALLSLLEAASSRTCRAAARSMPGISRRTCDLQGSASWVWMTIGRAAQSKGVMWAAP